MIICDGSALDWWRTPEDVRMRQVTEEDLARLPEDGRLRDCCTIPLRRNANEAVRAVHARLLGDLKGVNVPVQAICRPGERDTLSHILYARRSYREIPARYLHDIGGGLAVTAPALTVLRYANNLSLLESIELMYEFAGTYGAWWPTRRARAAQFLLAEDARAQPPRPALEEPEVYERPPLLTIGELEQAVADFPGMCGVAMTRRAVPYARAGAASPFQARLDMLLTLPVRVGSLAWPRPELNAAIELDPEAQALARGERCRGDYVWPERRVALLVRAPDDGEGAARPAAMGEFAAQSGRARAIEAMGYTVFEAAPEQMADGDALEALLSKMALALQAPLPARPREPKRDWDTLVKRLFKPVPRPRPRWF